MTRSVYLLISTTGTNCRLDNVQAAILNYKFKFYDQAIARRREIAQRYNDCLKVFSGIELPPPPSAADKNFDIFQEYEFCTERRDELRSHLASRGVVRCTMGRIRLHHLKKVVPDYNLPLTDRFF